MIAVRPRNTISFSTWVIKVIRLLELLWITRFIKIHLICGESFKSVRATADQAVTQGEYSEGLG